MADAKLRGFPRRVKRIGEHEQAIRQACVFCREHGRLASAVRLTTHKNATRSKFSDRADCTAQSFAVLTSAASRWPMRTRLPEWQIAPKYAQAGFSEGLGRRHQEGGLTVATCSMGKNDSVA